MMYNINLFENIPAWNKFFLLILVVFSGLMLSSLISLTVAIPLFNITFNQAWEYLNSGVPVSKIQLFKFNQIFQTIGAFIIPALFCGNIFSFSTREYLRLNYKPLYQNVILVAISLFFLIPVINFLSFLNSQLTLPDFFSDVERKIYSLESEANKLMMAVLEMNSLSDYFLNIFVIAILPAIGEEFLFRGVFQRLFSEWFKNVHVGIIVAAVLFSFIHFQFLGFIPRLMLGIYFGYLFLWSKSIWLPVAAHFFNNTFAISFYYLSNTSIVIKNMGELGTNDKDIYYVLGFLIINFVIGFYIFYNEKVKKIKGKEVKE